MKLRWPWTAPPVSLDAGQQARLAAWRTRAPVDKDIQAQEFRWVVVDVESTGLDVRHDRLLSIGAVEIVQTKVPIERAFYSVLKQARPSTASDILIHRIAGTEQLAGENPIEVLLAFLEYAGHAILVGYHAGFDEAMIERAARQHLGFTPAFDWLDLALLAPTIWSDAPPRTDLDWWLERHRIEVVERHNALADALATAQLMQIALQRLTAGSPQSAGAISQSAVPPSAGALLRRARDQRWLERGRR